MDHGGDVTQGELLYHAVRRDDKVLETATLLLDREAPTNRNMYEDGEEGFLRCGIMSQTPLHLAASMGMVDVVKLLVERGADVHKLDGMARIRQSGEAFTAWSTQRGPRTGIHGTYAILAPAFGVDVNLERQ